MPRPCTATRSSGWNAAGSSSDLARAHLVYGEWLRRENRRIDAREQLRAAYEMFHRMGAEAFAERAAVSSSQRARPRASARVATRDELDLLRSPRSPRLAAEGHTNPEIGGELFISPRTVEYHLGKVFTKLGITTRRELRKALPRQDQDAGR